MTWIETTYLNAINLEKVLYFSIHQRDVSSNDVLWSIRANFENIYLIIDIFPSQEEAEKRLKEIVEGLNGKIKWINLDKTTSH